MRVLGKLYVFLLFGTLWLSGCDLQPKIASIPDDIGAFISDRYPALLADPVTQPEIYNSAVTDYGVYASPELYGSANIDDYVLYASVDDYVLSPQDDENEKIIETVEEKSENTYVADEFETNVEYEEDDELDEEYVDESDYLSIPEYKVVLDEKQVESVPVQETSKDFVVVARGDTLYSIARKNNTTVPELAKINSLSEPYTLSIGQKINIRRAVDDNKSEKVILKEIEQPKVEAKQPESKQPEPKSQLVEKKITPAKKVEKQIVQPLQSTGVKRVDLSEITVKHGDTLYSLSRKYQIPVNDLAVLNKLSSPFTLSVGQKLKVPKLSDSQIRSMSEIKQIKSKTVGKVAESKPTVAEKKLDKKVEKVKSKTTEKKSEKQSDKSQSTKKNKSEKQSSVKSSVTKSVSNKTTKMSGSQKKTASTSQQKQPAKIVARSSSKFSWPVRGKILSQYGAKNKGLFNDGINISAALGTPVKAAENGVVAYAGNEVKGMGNLIIIQHSDGWMTVYAHLDSMSVRRGTKVSVGQQIGKIGKTGKVDKPQLHFEIRKGTKSYNPITYLKK